jgi:rare lipoprotein A
VHGRRYVPADEPRYDEVGLASWYSYESGRRTADGEPFGGADQVTAAHRTLPIPSEVEVTNLENGRRIRVRLNDRGPFVQDRLIDLSREAARQLDFLGRGTARVRVRYLGPAQPWPAPVFASASPHRLPKREETPHEVSSLELVADLPAVSASPR